MNVSERPVQVGAAAAMINILLDSCMDPGPLRHWSALSGTVLFAIVFVSASLVRLRASTRIEMLKPAMRTLRRGLCLPARTGGKWSNRLIDSTASCCVATTAFLVVFQGAGATIPKGSTTVARNLPLAVHDEQSYLFQARTMLAGRWTNDSSPESAAIFNRMHVLNEGRQRFASRYFPGTGLWIAPFEWLRQKVTHSGRAVAGSGDLEERLDILRFGHLVAQAIVAVVLYWIGRELAGRLCGIVSALLFAVSPGVAMFASLLLSHMPCLVGLSVFLLCIMRMMRTRCWGDALIGGCGLSFAMLCRPLTAAGFAFPFGIWMVVDGLRGSRSGRSSSHPASWRNLRLCRWLALPLLLGFGIQIWQNAAICGTPWKTPYQLYNDIYTPRHGYGFNNGVRGDAVDAPKRLTNYDVWAKNLTVDLAVDNVMTRWEASWRWTLGTIPLCIVLFIFVAVLRDLDRRWILLALSIVSLHAVYLPYWAAGILGHSYVMETGIIWLLMTGVVTREILVRCSAAHCWLAIPAWAALIVAAFAGNIHAGSSDQPPRVVQGIEQMFRASVEYERMQETVRISDLPRPLLVLIHPEHPNIHFDFVNNAPTLSEDIIYGRLSATDRSAAEIAALFPDRTCVLYDPVRRHLSEPLTEMNSRSP